MGQQCAANSLWAARRWGGGLPVGRGSERRILIPAPRTSSLGNTIWYCHTDACKPLGWSLQLGACFANFEITLVWFLHKWGFLIFFFFCFAGQFNYRWLAGESNVGGEGGLLAEWVVSSKSPRLFWSEGFFFLDLLSWVKGPELFQSGFTLTVRITA